MSQNTFAPLSRFLSPTNLPNLSKGNHVVVIGAGSFGGWTAWWLLKAGLRVTLVDTWGPGNARSSSGDETRVLRSTYGANRFYFDLNVRSRHLWLEAEKRWGKKFFTPSGVLWFCYEEKCPLVDDSIPFAREHGEEYEYLPLAEIQKRYPNVHTGNLHHGWLDPFGGFLFARESCMAVVDGFIAEGGTYIQQPATPGSIHNGRMDSLRLPATSLTADAYLFACGSWMGHIFPEVIGNKITCTKQEVFYLGAPSGQSDVWDRMPVWVDVDGSDYYYGIPGNRNRGFKIGVDRRGVVFDPTHGDHLPTPHVLEHAREFINRRFPGLRNAPVIESRVCPYENSPDGNFIFDIHPDASNVVFLGGGSGHGFKHGPALGEWVANALTGITAAK